MDPMSGLSLAVNILQLLDVATKVVSAGYAVSKATDGFTDGNREALEIASDIEVLALNLSKSERNWAAKKGGANIDAHDKALRGLCDGCREVARELIERLNSLRPHGKFRGLAVVRTSLLIVWKKDEIEQYTLRLQRYREELNTRLLSGLREHLMAIDTTHDARFTSLDINAQRLAHAIIDQRDIFSEKLELHRGLLEDIRSSQEKTNSLLVAITQDRSVSQLSTSPPGSSESIVWSSLSLIDAAKTGNVNMIRRLLASPTVDVNCMNQDGISALHCARDSSVAERLINKNANVDAEDFQGRTPLMAAARDRRLDIIKLLLGRGANVDLTDDGGNRAIDYVDDCPAASYMLQYFSESNYCDGGLLQMAWLGDIEGVRFFVKEGGNVNARNKEGGTSLHDACRNGDLDIVRLLLDHGADMEAMDNKRWRPILLANLSRRMQVMKELISRGADIEARSPLGRNLLLAACARMNWRFAQTLINRGANLTAQDNQGHTALHFAVLHRAKSDLIQALISNGAPLNMRNSSGETPLLIACMQEDADRVELLLNAGADPNSPPSNEAWTPLGYAASKGLLHVADLILSRAKEPVQLSVSPGSGRLVPLEEAVHLGHVDMIRLLLNHDASLGACNYLRFTPLHLAAAENATGVNTKPEVIDMLLEAGANIEAEDTYGMTPLGLASLDGNLAAVHRLLDAGANIESTADHPRASESDGGLTPIMLSVLKGSKNFEITQALLIKGAKIDARSTKVFTTALILSIENEAFESAVLLLEAGADSNLADIDGKTPLMAAAEVKAIHIVKELLRQGANPALRDRKGRTAWIRAKHAGKDRAIRHLLGPKSSDVPRDEEE